MHKILIVDDEPDVVKLGALSLRKAGYEVTTAIDGEDALSSVREFRPDLIILDIRLPKLDGFEVFEILKGDEELSKIPVIFATADISINLKEKIEELHAADYLLKPYSVQDVLEKLKICLT